jgi:hypothetical protein
MKTIIVVAALTVVGCSMAPATTASSFRTASNSHGQYYADQSKETVPPQLHKSSSHGGEE